MCSFDVFSNETLLQRVASSFQYDIIFISKELAANVSFRRKLLAGFNASTPVVLYVNNRRNQREVVLVMFSLYNI